MSFFIIDQIGYELESKTLFRNMTTTPDSARKRIINDLIKGLKVDGTWNLLDALWLMAAHDQQGARLNWKNPGTYTLTEVNSPTWTANQGYTGNGTSMYLDSNFNLSTNGVNYLQNDACYGVYSRTATETAGVEVGMAMAANYTLTLQLRRATNIAAYAVNNDGTVPTVANTSGSGFYLAVRTNSSTIFLYKNGSQLSTATNTSATIDNGTVPILARRITGTTFDSYSSKQLSVVCFGSGAINQSNLYTRIQNYMTRLGTQV